MKMRAVLIWLLGLGLLTSSCNELESQNAGDTAASASLEAGDDSEAAENGLSITEIATSDNASSQDSLGGYEESPFSKYVYVKNGENALLIDFNFFPTGTDFDSETKKATIPCAVADADDDDADVSVNAPLEEEEDCESITVDLSAATFAFYGLEFTYADSLDVFVEIFEFRITTQGFTDALDGAAIEPDRDEADLETVYNAVMDRRT